MATEPTAAWQDSLVEIRRIHDEIVEDPDYGDATRTGRQPVYTVHPAAAVLIIGQAPGARAQDSGVPWGDPSGVVLRRWLGVNDDQFYDPATFALLPMDFYYPGKGPRGDLPPRPGFAERWHRGLIAQLRNVRLSVLVGRYAQRHYLPSGGRGLTDTVRGFREHLPDQMPVVHPSPLNFRWQSRNPWFLEEAVPALQDRVKEVLGS